MSGNLVREKKGLQYVRNFEKGGKGPCQELWIERRKVHVKGFV